MKPTRSASTITVFEPWAYGFVEGVTRLSLGGSFLTYSDTGSELEGRTHTRAVLGTQIGGQSGMIPIRFIFLTLKELL